MAFNVVAGMAFCGISYYLYSRQQQKPDKLKINLMYAAEALRYTQEAMPYGAVNYREDFKGVSFAKILKMDAMIKESEEAVKDLPFHYNYDKIMEKVSIVAKKHKIGNCDEQTSVAYTYLKNEKNLRKVVRLSLVKGDHAFVVIGMNPLGDVKDPATWGQNAVVCEPWGKRYFPAVQLFDQLNKLSPRTIYDPNVHTIGWNSFGTNPPEVAIATGLRFHDCTNKRQYAKNILAKREGTDGNKYEKVIDSYLSDYLDKKSKPKVPPSLSESELKAVEDVYSKFIAGANVKE